MGIPQGTARTWRMTSGVIRRSTRPGCARARMDGSPMWPRMRRYSSASSCSLTAWSPNSGSSAPPGVRASNDASRRTVNGEMRTGGRFGPAAGSWVPNRSTRSAARPASIPPSDISTMSRTASGSASPRSSSSVVRSRSSGIRARPDSSDEDVGPAAQSGDDVRQRVHRRRSAALRLLDGVEDDEQRAVDLVERLGEQVRPVRVGTGRLPDGARGAVVAVRRLVEDAGAHVGEGSRARGELDLQLLRDARDELGGVHRVERRVVEVQQRDQTALPRFDASVTSTTNRATRADLPTPPIPQSATAFPCGSRNRSPSCARTSCRPTKWSVAIDRASANRRRRRRWSARSSGSGTSNRRPPHHLATTDSAAVSSSSSATTSSWSIRSAATGRAPAGPGSRPRGRPPRARAAGRPGPRTRTDRCAPRRRGSTRPVRRTPGRDGTPRRGSRSRRRSTAPVRGGRPGRR